MVRQRPVPKTVAKTIGDLEHGLYDLERIADEAERWSAVRAELTAWIDSCTSSNTGWARYRVVKLLAEAIAERDRRKNV